jgi:hypothetical protein
MAILLLVGQKERVAVAVYQRLQVYHVLISKSANCTTYAGMQVSLQQFGPLSPVNRFKMVKDKCATTLPATTPNTGACLAVDLSRLDTRSALTCQI